MKTIILAGGLGSRLSEETHDKPKPMVALGQHPILWHIMEIFALQGHTDFIIATGYKHEIIDAWAKSLNTSWNIATIFTGDTTQTGGRILRCMNQFVEEDYLITYGDGLANVKIKDLISLHHQEGRLATVTAVRPPARFGTLTLDGNTVVNFGEKNQADEGWINGGFFVVNRKVAKLIHSDSTLFETGPLPILATLNQLSAYKHYGFWHPMDTLREKNILTDFASQEIPPWLSL